MKGTPKIAILIDGDNASAALIEPILNEVSKFGRITIKRIYADWTSQGMNQWKEQLNRYAIKPVQKFAYTQGKNSTDTALIIDAMDILYSKAVEQFCIVSSDSDYTGIAHRIREEGLDIIGIGQSHTPEAFVKACDNFIYTEILAVKPQDSKESSDEFIAPKTNVKGPRPKSAGGADTVSNKPIVNAKVRLPEIDLAKFVNSVTNKPIDKVLIDNAFNMVVDQINGVALLSSFSNALRKIDPTFDNRNFGYSSFRKFCEALQPKYLLDDADDKSLKLLLNEGKKAVVKTTKKSNRKPDLRQLPS